MNPPEKKVPDKDTEEEETGSPGRRSALTLYPVRFAMELKSVRLEIPEGGNIIVGQSHFIKTVEDIYEAIVNTAPQMKFGVAFNEASGPRLTRADGNDADMKALAIRNATALAAGHVFVVAMRDGFPINVLGRIKDVPEVCSIFCATANPVRGDRRAKREPDAAFWA